MDSGVSTAARSELRERRLATLNGASNHGEEGGTLIQRELTPLTLLAVDHYGVFTRQQAFERGFSALELARGLRTKAIASVRRRFYRVDGADPDIVRAVEAGGVLSGFSALAKYGVPVPDDSRLHVRIPRATRSDRIRRSRRRNRGLLLGFSHARIGEAKARVAVDPPRVALSFVAANCTPEDLGVVIDAMLRLGLLPQDELESIEALLPQRFRSTFAFASRLPESLSESLAHRRLLAAGIPVVPQVQLGRRRVDFLIGDRLVLEVDSQQFHASRSQRRADYERDRELQAQGYLVFRVDFADVLYAWEAVLAEIRRIVRRGGRVTTLRPRPRTATAA